MAKMRQNIVTLLTDLGTRDGSVATIKGVLLSLLPGVRIIDATHAIAPGDVLTGALVLNQLVRYFPAGTVHIAAVGAEDGLSPRILAARYGDQYVLAPDNGLVTLVDLRLRLQGMVSVRNVMFFLKERTGFSGRDIFAPVAVELLAGLELARLGPPPATYKLLDLPMPKVEGMAITGEIIHITSEGDCLTNISRAELLTVLPEVDKLQFMVGPHELGLLRPGRLFAAPGEAVVMLGPLGVVVLGVNGGSAADQLGLKVGDRVQGKHLPVRAALQ